MRLAGRLEHVVPVDGSLAGLDIDTRDDALLRVIRERLGPQKLSRGAVQHEQAASFTDSDRQIDFLPARDVWINPLHEFGIGIEARAHQRSLMGVIGIPIVAREMLVIPGEFPGRGIERDGRVAVEIRGRGARDRVGISVMPRRALVRHRIGDAPVEHLAYRIVGARESPGRCQPLVDRRAAPGFIARFADCRSRVESPGFLAGESVVSRDIAVRPIAGARAAGDDLAFDDQRAGSISARIDLGLPARLAGTRVQADHETVGRGVGDDVLVNRQRFGTFLSCDVGGHVALVLPQHVPARGIQGLHNAAGIHHVHDAVVNDRDSFGLPRAHAAFPGQVELSHILLVDLLQRAEALGIVGAAEHQPVVRARVFEHLLGDGDVLLNLSY